MIYVNKMGLKLRQFRLCVVKKQCLTRFHDTQGAEVEFPPPKMTQIYLNYFLVNMVSYTSPKFNDTACLMFTKSSGAVFVNFWMNRFSKYFLIKNGL